MSEITYGDLSLDEFFEKFDESRWICKCGHIADRHREEGDRCWDCTDCQGLSDEPITVIELLNLHYGTDYVPGDYDTQLPGKWSHLLASGPYNKNLAITSTVQKQIWGYEDPMTWANYEVLQENWKDHPALCDAGYSDCNSIGLQWNAPCPFDLIETLESLENYPALDDERMSNIESEWIDAGWDDYGILDATRELEKLLEVAGHEFDLDSQVLKDELREDIRFDESNPPYWETGGGAVFSSKKIIEANFQKYLFGLRMKAE